MKPYEKVSESFDTLTREKVQYKIIDALDNLPIDYTWSFSDLTQKDTNYITHGYYTYPAKFIPQLANRLILEYSNEGDTVLDPMMGSGTTVVESLVAGRKALGSDINEIAYMVATAKATPIDEKKLLVEYNRIYDTCYGNNLFYSGNYSSEQFVITNERIDYWFSKEQKEKLEILLSAITKIDDEKIKTFFLVCFAQILKSASVWMQKSIKPTRDKNKIPICAFTLFFKHAKKMLKKNYEYCLLLNDKIKNNFNSSANIQIGDARNLNIENNTIDLIVTSPPYVTSYEYADLHQLPLLWFDYLKDLPAFRKKFIGSSFSNTRTEILGSTIAKEIISKLKNKKQVEVKNYYCDMFQVFLEMYRVLKNNATACIVIGNTEFQGVDILNAEVFLEQMQTIGFKTKKIIHREIPSKMLPSTRDAKTGKFAKAKDASSIIYPTEYILVMEK